MATHRAVRRHVGRRRVRAGTVLLAVGMTVMVGGSGALPRAPGGNAAEAGVRPAALQTAGLATVDIPAPRPAPVRVPAEPVLPDGSGEGRRIVFDQSEQRVWLVEADGDVDLTYLVSGSRFDNLQPGSYAVLSKSRYASAFDGSGRMEYFVRFATGRSEPIGFHSVPVDNAGRIEQTKAQLGTPLSAGCVRQWMPDAITLWDFAPIGTPVIVTA